MPVSLRGGANRARRPLALLRPPSLSLSLNPTGWPVPSLPLFPPSFPSSFLPLRQSLRQPRATTPPNLRLPFVRPGRAPPPASPKPRPSHHIQHLATCICVLLLPPACHPERKREQKNQINKKTPHVHTILLELRSPLDHQGLPSTIISDSIELRPASLGITRNLHYRSHNVGARGDGWGPDTR